MEDKNQALLQRRATALPKGVGLMNPIFAKRALNAEVWDENGDRYIDFAAGIAVVNTGHRHPKIIEAVAAQLALFTHTCHHVLPYENYVHLAERLNNLVPGDFDKKTVFVTTGAEAVENAIKIARAHTGRTGVIAFSGGFHGRTYMGMSLTGKVAPYKTKFGSMMPDIYHAPFPIAAHGVSVADSLAGLDRIFKSEIEVKRVAAIIIEPIQGEGGFYPVPQELMTALRALCDQHGMVLIADEIQTGFGRTGKYFAMENYGIAADLTCMAKGLAGGMPLAAVTGRADIMDAPEPGGLGGTYGGNPLSIAAAHAVLDVIEVEQLCQRANQMGARLQERLKDISEDVAQISDVRGMGMMVAVEFNDLSGQPDPAFTAKVKDLALANKLVLLTCGVYGNVVRFLAPLTIEIALFDEAMDILERSIKEAAGQ